MVFVSPISTVSTKDFFACLTLGDNPFYIALKGIIRVDLRKGHNFIISRFNIKRCTFPPKTISIEPILDTEKEVRSLARILPGTLPKS